MFLTDSSSVADRHTFFDGQRLFADDLQGVEQFHRTLRELHNRSLHQPGIGTGFEVNASRGDRTVEILPGYAIDGMGHEILSTERVAEAVPPVASDDAGEAVFFDLAVSYRDDLEEAEVRRGVCAPSGVVRLREEPTFCWIRLERGQDGELHPADAQHAQDLIHCRKIRLARIEVKDCRLQNLLLELRHAARPERISYTGSGEHPLHTLPFMPVPKEDDVNDFQRTLLEPHAQMIDNLNKLNGLPEVLREQLASEEEVTALFGIDRVTADGILDASTEEAWSTFFEHLAIWIITLRVRVCTQSAQFSRTPCYSLSFRMPPIDPANPQAIFETVRQAAFKIALSALTSIIKSTPTFFDLQLLYPASFNKDVTDGTSLIDGIGLQLEKTREKLVADASILWMGIE